MNLVHNDTEHCCTLWWNALTIEKPMTDTIWRLSIGNFFQRAGTLTYCITYRECAYRLVPKFVWKYLLVEWTAQKMKFSTKAFFSECEQIHRKLQICSHLLKKSLMENFIFRAVMYLRINYSLNYFPDAKIL